MRALDVSRHRAGAARHVARARRGVLVPLGVPPTNLAAQTAGKLRVDPGNPANSFILDKLNGTLLPGEGDRMPLQLKRLPDNAIQLVEEWVAAGAPETGFVAPSGCPGP